MILALALLACTVKSDDTGEETVAPPTISWLSPTDGDTVAAGDVSCSTVIGAFTLQDPAKHNDGAPIGYVSVSVDDVEILTTGDTTFTLTLDAGAHDLMAALFYDDGDEVSANTDRLCDEDDADASCAPVMAMISVTAE